jgi:hypothetical protein
VKLLIPALMLHDCQQDQSGGNFKLSESPSLIKINANYSLQESHEISGSLSKQHRKSSQAVEDVLHVENPISELFTF